MRSRVFFLLFVAAACSTPKEAAHGDQNNFSSDVDFLKRYTNIILLQSDDGKMQLALSPALQGRVMTSTSNGSDGFSFGWINRNAFAAGDTSTHMNAFGGEDRFWLGPEGGQYSIYFTKGSEFTFDNWHVPPIIDIEPFDVVEQSTTSAAFHRDGTLTNYSAANFKFAIDRKVELLTRSDISKIISYPVSDSLSVVGFQSANVLKNTGDNAWEKNSGLLSIWILGMFNPSEDAVVFLPVQKNPSQDSVVVNDRYFGKVPEDRLAVEDNMIYFKADGKLRSKIGLSGTTATEWLGSFDGANNILTIVNYSKPSNNAEYVNSFWEIQKDPYGGDVVNSYNDGPPAPGEKPMGPFYELETSSPAAALTPGDSIVHVHTTLHFQGEKKALDNVTMQVFGIRVDDIKRGLSR